MNATKLLDAFSQIDQELLAEADTFRKAPRPLPRLRYALIAASLTLLIALIPITVTIANRTAPPPPVTNPPVTDAPLPNTHLSITDIPGAEAIDSDTLPKNFSGFDYHPGPNLTPIDTSAHQWATTVRENYSTSKGTVENIKSILIQDGELYYHITQFTLNVQTHYFNTDGKDTVSLINVTLYKKNSNYFTVQNPYIITEEHSIYYDMGLYAEENPTGLCVYESAKNHTVTIQGITYALSEYADYYLVAHMQYRRFSSTNPDRGEFGFGNRARFFIYCFTDTEHERCNRRDR